MSIWGRGSDSPKPSVKWGRQLNIDADNLFCDAMECGKDKPSGYTDMHRSSRHIELSYTLVAVLSPYSGLFAILHS